MSDADKNLGEAPEAYWTWLTPNAIHSRYIGMEPWHDEQYSSAPADWWGVASHKRPSTETWPDA